MIILENWIKPNLAILFNASSLIASTIISAVFGFFYWWLAARWFPPESVGVASAAISAMLLLGTIGVMGFGTLLIGELPRSNGNEGSLIITSLVIVSLVGFILGMLFALVVPFLSTDLQPLGENLEAIGLFSLGVSLTSLTLVLDQALIGLLRGEFQLGRNFVFALGKLLAILIIGFYLIEKDGMIIFKTWIIGILASLSALAIYLIIRNTHIFYRPNFGLMRVLGRPALSHHSLNLVLQAPGFALPILVTILLSARLNAYFYISWMIASLIYIGPIALSTVLYAVSANHTSDLSQKMKLTLNLSFIYGLVANVALLFIGSEILELFGPLYKENAISLRILALGVFPLIIRVHYVALFRIYNRIIQATKLILVTSLIAIALAVIGSMIAGLYGLTLGWVAGMCLEAIALTPVLVSVVVFGKVPAVWDDNNNKTSSLFDYTSIDKTRFDL